MNLARQAITIATCCAFFLATVKFIVGILSGSVAVLSSAIDSMMGFTISAFNFLAPKKSAQKPSEHYNFGFPKIKALMGFLEGCFIVGIRILIFYQSVMKIYHRENVEDLNSGIAVMIFALVVTFLLMFYLSFVAEKTRSLIVESGYLRHKSDFLSNFFTLLASILIYFTNWHVIDVIFGIIVSIYTSFSASKIIKKALIFLMDEALDGEILEKIKTLINNHQEVISFHNLKTRKTPSINYISIHLVFCPMISLLSVHRISNEIEQKIRETSQEQKWEVHIHLDPYDDQGEERDRIRE